MIVVLSFTLQNSKVNAYDCVQGMTYQVETITIEGCEYDVGLCYSCGLTNPGEVWVVEITKLDPNCDPGISFPLVVKHIYLQVSTSSFIYSNLCQDPPPCPTGNEMVVKKWACWQIQMINYLGEETYKYKPCNYDAYCKERYAHCWNEDEQRVERIFLESTYVGVPDCNLEAWEVSLPGKVGEETKCYRQFSSCED